MAEEGTRETLSSRLGFLLLAAGCAIGLGNIWRFPFVAGKYGGGAFVLLYLIFLVVLGLPVLVMELSVGRASRRNLVGAYDLLAAQGKTQWKQLGYVLFSGNAILLMFYTTVCGWMLAYTLFMFRESLAGLSAAEIGGFFDAFIGKPWSMVGWMSVAVVLSALVCFAGLRAGVERVVKWMMSLLLVMLVVLSLHSLRLPGAAEGLKFYLLPSWERVQAAGVAEVFMAAMAQAFFTLSLGIGSMEIFGSYIDRKNSLLRESVTIVGLDTLVALLAGVIIFPACFSFQVDAASGPGLVFITLPNVFNQMTGGKWWGVLFFGFLSLAALTTVIAVMENIIAFVMEQWHLPRRRASCLTGVGLAVLSLPCAFGFNLLAHIQPLGAGSTILDFEDFLISDNLLPLGSLCLVLFCSRRFGWGWQGFRTEANYGAGMKLPQWPRLYVTWVLPTVIIFLYVVSYLNRFLPGWQEIFQL